MPKPVVILLHGLALNAFCMKRIQNGLARAGYEVHNIDYPSRKKNTAQLAQEIYQKILPYCNQDDISLNIVTFSLGGVIIREILSQHPISNLRRMVMLGPPLHGSEIVDFFYNNKIFRWFFGPVWPELSTHVQHKDFLPANHFELGIIAGNSCLDPICYFILPRPHDGKVTINSTKHKNMQDHIVLPTSHVSMLLSKKVILQVVHFLKQGNFAPHPRSK